MDQTVQTRVIIKVLEFVVSSIGDVGNALQLGKRFLDFPSPTYVASAMKYMALVQFSNFSRPCREYSITSRLERARIMCGA